MRILSTVTPAFQPLVQRWLMPSLQRLGYADRLDVVVDQSPQARGSGDFRTPGFDQHVFNKLDGIADWCERVRAPFLVTDADILYVRPFDALVLDLLGNRDLLLACEFPGRIDQYNIGQMVVRPSAETAHFFRRVAGELRAGATRASGVRRIVRRFRRQRAANQGHLDQALRASALRHGPLPPTFANTAIWETLTPDQRQQIVSYHATKTLPSPGRTSLAQKHKRLADVAQACGLEMPGA